MNRSSILRAPSAAGKFAHQPPNIVSARGCGHTSPFIPWRLFCSTFFFLSPWASRASAHSPGVVPQRAIKSVAMLPACHLLPQWGTDTHRQAHKHHFQEGLCDGRNKKEKNLLWKINACSTEHSRGSVDGEMPKALTAFKRQWLPCWLSLTFQHWSSCFCSQRNITNV